MALMPWRADDDDPEPDPIAMAVDDSPQPPAQLEGDEVMQALERATPDGCPS